MVISAKGSAKISASSSRRSSDDRGFLLQAVRVALLTENGSPPRSSVTAALLPRRPRNLKRRRNLYSTMRALSHDVVRREIGAAAQPLGVGRDAEHLAVGPGAHAPEHHTRRIRQVLRERRERDGADRWRTRVVQHDDLGALGAVHLVEDGEHVRDGCTVARGSSQAAKQRTRFGSLLASSTM